ncbi:hypothetical protein [Bradyrhizobium sp. SYSU BS000235]|uniref:hypothetical protein n=1 Tax=Bradyrhizobium sp. SYSU BS000235 TaxID=3411332 RepID=UPI003C77A4E6
MANINAHSYASVMNAPAANPETRYDVYVLAGKSRFYFRNDNRGVTLTDERIAWMLDGQSDSAPFKNVASVHLESGGGLNKCLIKFADGYQLFISDSNARGLADETQAPIYRAFVHDFHARLVAAGATSIRFTAGYMGARYHVVLVCILLLCLLCVVGSLVMLFVTGYFQVLFAAMAGAGLCWPLVWLIGKNGPRDYDPTRPPEELLR